MSINASNQGSTIYIFSVAEAVVLVTRDEKYCVVIQVNSFVIFPWPHLHTGTARQTYHAARMREIKMVRFLYFIFLSLLYFMHIYTCIACRHVSRIGNFAICRLNDMGSVVELMIKLYYMISPNYIFNS